MYQFLFKAFGKKTADVLIVLWYTGLIFLVYYFLPAEAGEFRYLDY